VKTSRPRTRKVGRAEKQVLCHLRHLGRVEDAISGFTPSFFNYCASHLPACGGHLFRKQAFTFRIAL
jgi:hypothetical protein